MSGEVVGRDAEREAATRFLRELTGGPSALLFAGEPGIGKTTVWRSTVEQARASSYLVLSAQPVEPEAKLAFAALADLLEPVVDGALSDLSEPQRHALAVALLREDPGARRLDQRAVSAAVLSVLRALAATTPVLVALDDVQWLDRASARVLEFAIRRLGDTPVRVLACERIEEGLTPPLDLDRAVPDGRCTRVSMGPLSLAALHRVIKEQLGRPLPRRTLVRVHGAVGGNPFFAVELARLVRDDASPSAALPMPDSLRRLVDRRIAGLSTSVRAALLAAAALRSPTIDSVAAATPGRRTDAVRALERAAEAGVIALDGREIRFSHPLFAAGVYSSARPTERRLTHRRLAAVVDGMEERARHLALGAAAADERLALALDTAAEGARRRGAPEAAAELAEHARALTPAGRAAEFQRRTIQLAEYEFHAGELSRARDLLEGILDNISPGRVRADALRLLGEVRYHEESFPEAIRVLEEALEHVGDDLGLESAIETSLAFAVHIGGDFVGAKRHGDRALSLAEDLGEPALLAEALAVSLMPTFLLGLGLDESKVERALRLEDPYRPVPIMMRPSLCAGYLALFVGELDRCRSILSPLRERILDRGEDGDLPYVSCYLSWATCWQGDFAAAAKYSEESLETAARIGSASARCFSLAFASVASAYAGDVALTKSRAEECLVLAPRTGLGIASHWAAWAQGLIALSLDDPQAADAALGSLSTMFEEGFPDPIVAFFVSDEVEALLALGLIDRAERLLAGFDEAAKRLERGWAMMQSARCRALLLAARGDLEAASEFSREALDIGAGLELRLEVARTFLVAGKIERRRRSKRAAADYLGRALQVFENAGARLWAEQARRELNRVGLRPTAPRELTPSERRVAELAASGLTNREVAGALFISPKTVEANLARAYRKLGIRSRAELGAVLAASSTLAQTLTQM